MSDLRAAFPVLEKLVYLNAGSVGPVPTAAVRAAEAALRDDLEHGRAGKDRFEGLIAQLDELRSRVAAIFGSQESEIAVTGATTDGVNTVLGGLDLQPGDEILTTDEEHPGLLAPLAVARRRRGVRLRVVPFDEIAAAVDERTRLVACSHVSWQTGAVVDTAALAASPAPVLLDGAQGLGAVATDVGELGCDFYAASGQKWLCGPNGSGYLYVNSERIDDLLPPSPGYFTVSDGVRALELELRDGARRFDSGLPAAHDLAWALAALDVLDAEGFDGLTERATTLADGLARALAAAGLTVAQRGASTLVSWEAADPEREATRLSDAGFVARNLPGTRYVRASVGAWNSEDELVQLVRAAASS